MPYDYDLLVIGSGPGGQKAAIQAAKLGKRVAVVDRREMVGGVCANTGTIPSKTLREAVLYLTGMSERGIYGQSYRVKEEISSQDVFHRTQHVVQREIDVVRAQLARNQVLLLNGHARFLDPHALCVTAASGEERRVSAARIVIAYASMFAALGCKVTVVEQRRRLLEFCDSQIIEALQYHLRDLNVIFRFDEKVTAVEKRESGAVTHLASGKLIPADAVLYSTG